MNLTIMVGCLWTELRDNNHNASLLVVKNKRINTILYTANYRKSITRVFFWISLFYCLACIAIMVMKKKNDWRVHHLCNNITPIVIIWLTLIPISLTLFHDLLSRLVAPKPNKYCEHHDNCDNVDHPCINYGVEVPSVAAYTLPGIVHAGN